jgi:hypothetical protein
MAEEQNGTYFYILIISFAQYNLISAIAQQRAHTITSHQDCHLSSLGKQLLDFGKEYLVVQPHTPKIVS